MRMSWTAVGRAALYSMHHQGCVETKTMTQHDAVPDIQKPLSRVASRCIFALACMMPVEHGLTCTSGLQAREQLRQVRAQCRDLASDLDIARRQAAVRSSRSAVPPKPFFLLLPHSCLWQQCLTALCHNGSNRPLLSNLSIKVQLQNSGSLHELINHLTLRQEVSKALGV